MARVVCLLFCLLVVVACGSPQYPPQPPTPAPVPPLARYNVCQVDAALCGGLANPTSEIRQFSQRESRSPEILLTGPLAGAPAVGSRSAGLVARVYKQLASPPRVAQAPHPIESSRAPRPELDIEAHLTLEVADTTLATSRVRALTRAMSGEITSEVVEDTESELGVALSVRVPSLNVERYLADLKRVGKVRSFRSQATEMNGKIADATLAARNVASALERYRALLAQAANVSEMAALEKEIVRLENTLAQIELDLELTRDRVARSRVYVRLTVPKEERIQENAKLQVGVRLPYLVDLEPKGSSSSYFGAGLSVLIVRSFNLDLDLMTHTEDERRDGVDLLAASAGSELYSNLLGAGKRRYFNPYFGFRAGYANLMGDDALLLGGSLGLELVRSSALMLEVHARTYAVLAATDGTHVFIQPALAFHAAY